MNQHEQQLDRLFRVYRSACPDPEPSANFMPMLWDRIESRRSFSFVFQKFARVFVTASGVACLLLAALNIVPEKSAGAAPTQFATYTDVLSADSAVEHAYFSQALRPEEVGLPTSVH